MFKRISLAISGVLVLAIAVLSTNAYSMPFKGKAWVAHHIEYNNETHDYYFAIAPMDIEIDPESVKLKGFTIKKSGDDLDFSELTTEVNFLWFEIEKFKDKKKYKFSFKDANDKKKYKFSFKDTNNNKYEGEALFARFNNPVGGEPTIPVQEPATILLIGSGLIGIAGFGRKKFIKK